jgi:hypothetical protein
MHRRLSPNNVGRKQLELIRFFQGTGEIPLIGGT